MARIPESEIERIKGTIDLVALIQSKGIELKKHGGKDLVACCPFHEEDTGSFIVTPGKNLWHCMGCGKGGTVIDFVMVHEGLSFRHAFELLAHGDKAALFRANGPIKATRARKLESPVEFEADDYTATRQIVDYYHERLKQSREAQNYLRKRGITEEAEDHFRIGFADRTLGLRLPPTPTKAGGEIRERLKRVGLLREETGHEHFSGSVVFPIFNEAGNITEIYGRKINDNLRVGTAYHLYLPGPHVGIWNREALKESREIILCESVIDALSFWCAGLKNVSCIYGTEGFTDELWKALNAYRTERIYLAYDADEAGERAAERDAGRMKAEGMEVLRIKFPWEMDANEYARKVTPAKKSLPLLVQAAQWMGKVVKPVEDPAPASSSLVAAIVSSSEGEEAAKEKCPLPPVAPMVIPTAMPVVNAPELEARGEAWILNLEGREYRVSGLEKTLGGEHLKIGLRVRVQSAGGAERFHLDQIDLMRDGDRRRFIERAAEETAQGQELFKRDLGRLLLAVETAQAQMMKPAEAVAATVELSPEEKEAALDWLRKPDLIGRLRMAFRQAGIIGEDNNTLVAYLAGVSRKLERPLAIIIQSASAAGKTTLMDAVLSFFPEEDRVKYSAMTGQSLYYLGETNLKHKILAVVEEAGAEKASYALKLLQSEGELTIASTGKDPNTGRMVTQEYRVEGPVMIFLTTTAIDLDEELQNRCLTLAVDESHEQTARIHQMQRERRTLSGLTAREERKEVLTLLRNAQRLLVPVEVINPYAPRLTFPSGRTRNRRDHEKYLTLIDAIALLHQHQRERGRHRVRGGEVEYIEVSLEDIRLANEIAPEVLGRSLDELPPQTRRLLEAVRELVKSKRESESEKTAFTFSRREIKEVTGWSLTQVRVHLARLIELEFIAARCGRFGSAFHYELLIDADGTEKPATVGLIEVKDLEKPVAYDVNLAGEKGNLAGGGKMTSARVNGHKASTLSTTWRPDGNAHQGGPEIGIVS